MRIRDYLVITLLFFIVGCSSVPSGSVLGGGVKKEYSLKELCEQYDIDWEWDEFAEIVTLYYADSKIRVLIDNPTVVLNDKNVFLSGPVRIEEGIVVVPVDFKEKVIDKVVYQPKLKKKGSKVRITRRSRKVIVIDAGHGGKDPGATGRSGLFEKVVVLDISHRVKGYLENAGYKVVMTRVDDKFISLQKRTEIASKANADLFVSIHANSTHSRRVHGMEVFTSKPLIGDTRNEEQRLTNQKLTYEQLMMKKEDKKLCKIVDDMMYLHKATESRQIAEKMATDLPKYVKAKNRGHKHAGFYVLRNTLIPAVLIETGFLSNIREEKLLKTIKYREKLAKGIVQNLLDYMNE